MTNLEHIIENTLDAFSEGYNAEQITGFIKTDMNLPEQPLTVEQIYEICQYVWCTYLDNGNNLKKESMTNAEKVAKNTNEMASLIVYPDDTNWCRYCIYQFGKNCMGRGTEECEKAVKEWLESEAEEYDL